MDRTSEVFFHFEGRAVLLAFDVLGEIARSKSGCESFNTSVLILVTYENAVIKLLCLSVKLAIIPSFRLTPNLLFFLALIQIDMVVTSTILMSPLTDEPLFSWLYVIMYTFFMCLAFSYVKFMSGIIAISN